MAEQLEKLMAEYVDPATTRARAKWLRQEIERLSAQTMSKDEVELALRRVLAKGQK